MPQAAYTARSSTRSRLRKAKVALSLTADQRQALRDWLDANVHKATYQDSWTEYQKDENGHFVLVNTGTAEEPVWERVVTQVHNFTYLDTAELALRLWRKLNKHFPDKAAAADLGDIEALFEDKLTQLLALAGADSVGSSPLRYDDFKDEDPDL